MATNKFKDPKYPDSSERDIQKAAVECNTEEAKNHMAIKFRYYEIVVPYLEGVKIIEALKHAEYVSDDIAWDYHKIIPIGGDNQITSRVMSHADYVDQKMRHLLNIKEKPPKESVF